MDGYKSGVGLDDSLEGVALVVHDDLLADLQVGLERLLALRVQHPGLDRHSVRRPVDEDQLAYLHIVLVGELHVEGGVSGLVLGEALEEVLPASLSGA